MKRFISILLCIASILTIMSFSGCAEKKQETETTVPVTEQTDIKVLGEGSRKFFFTVTDADGAESKFEIHTNSGKVSDALTELGLIKGENGPYGLFVKEVNGKVYDYEKDHLYWAFYVNGKMSDKGVDYVEITDGADYAFKAE